MALESITLLVSGHELLYSISVGVLPLLLSKGAFTRSLLMVKEWMLCIICQGQLHQVTNVYLKNQQLDPIIRVAVSAAGSSYHSMELSSPPQE